MPSPQTLPQPPKHYGKPGNKEPIPFKLKQYHISTVFKDDNEYQAITTGNEKTFVLRKVENGKLTDEYILHHLKEENWVKTTYNSEDALKAALAPALGVEPSVIEEQYKEKWGKQWVDPVELRKKVCENGMFGKDKFPEASYFRIDGKLPRKKLWQALPSKTIELLYELSRINGASTEKLGKLFDTALTKPLDNQFKIIKEIVKAGAEENRKNFNTLLKDTPLQGLFDEIAAREENREFAFRDPLSRSMKFEISTFLRTGFPSLNRAMRFLKTHTTYDGPENEEFRRDLAQRMMDALANQKRSKADQLNTLLRNQANIDDGPDLTQASPLKTNRIFSQFEKLFKLTAEIKRDDQTLKEKLSTLDTNIANIDASSLIKPMLEKQSKKLRSMFEKYFYTLPNKKALIDFAFTEIEAMDNLINNPQDDNVNKQAEAESFNTLNHFLSWFALHLTPNTAFRTLIETNLQHIHNDSYNKIKFPELFSQINDWLKLHTSQLLEEASSAVRHFEDAFLKQDEVIGADIDKYEETHAALQQKAKEIEFLLQIFMYARALNFRHLDPPLPAPEERAEKLQEIKERIDLALRVAPTPDKKDELRRAYTITVSNIPGKIETKKVHNFNKLTEIPSKREYENGAKTTIQYEEDKNKKQTGRAYIRNTADEKMEVSTRHATKELFDTFGPDKIYTVDNPYDIKMAAEAFNWLVHHGVPPKNIRVQSHQNIDEGFQYLWPETISKFSSEQLAELTPKQLKKIPADVWRALPRAVIAGIPLATLRRTFNPYGEQTKAINEAGAENGDNNLRQTICVR